MNQRAGWKIAFIVLGAVLALVAAIAGGIYFYRKANYQTIAAEVRSVEEQCMLERRRSSSRSGGGRREVGPMSCWEAQERHDSGGYSNYRIVPVETVRVTYRSPADGQMHESSFTYRGDKYRASHAGDRIDIRAHTSNPQDILSIDSL